MKDKDAGCMTAGMGAGMLPQRAPMFDEKPIEEKIEALRDALIFSAETNARLTEAVANMQAHRHGDRGEILIPLGMAGNGFIGQNLALDRPQSPRIPYGLRKTTD